MLRPRKNLIDWSVECIEKRTSVYDTIFETLFLLVKVDNKVAQEIQEGVQSIFEQKKTELFEKKRWTLPSFKDKYRDSKTEALYKRLKKESNLMPEIYRITTRRLKDILNDLPPDNKVSSVKPEKECQVYQLLLKWLTKMRANGVELGKK